jgi:N-acetylglucosamine-6-phosphate deacetylase
MTERASPLRELSGCVLTPEGWLDGRLHFDERLRHVEGVACDPSRHAGPYILPGFVDLHVHGGGGHDVMEAGPALRHIARTHARHGTTSLLATTMTAPRADIETALRAAAGVVAARQPGEARVLGVHLEGPYLSPQRLGAQPDLVAEADLAAVRHLLELAPIRVLTMAPEVAAHLALIPQLVGLGLRVQIGHSAGRYEDGVAALAQGAAGFTHLFNAMSGLHHREPGMVGAALAHARHAELIPDLLHVHPGAIHAALRAIPGLYCVSDATAAAGMPDGAYRLGPQTVHKCLGAVRLSDGTLAGSTLTMDQALRNLVALGLDLAEASRRVSTLACDYLGEAQRGRIRTGCLADLVLLDRQLQVQSVYVEGGPCGLDDA